MEPVNNLEPLKSYCGKFLRAIRNVRGLTAVDIAKKHDITESSIYDYEKGRSYPKNENAITLFSALKIKQEIFERCVKDSIIKEIEAGGRMHSDGTVEPPQKTVRLVREDVETKALEIIRESKDAEIAERANAAGSATGNSCGDPIFKRLNSIWESLENEQKMDLLEMAIRFDTKNKENEK